MANVSWQKALIDAGGPMLKGLIEQAVGGGLKGKIAGGLADAALKSLADVFGTEPDPIAIGDAIERDPIGAPSKVQMVEAELRSTIDIGAGDLTNYLALLQADQRHEGLLTRIWRPLFAIVFTVVYATVIGTICFLMINRDLGTLNNLGEVTGFLTFAFVAGCAVLGVQVWQRTEEKKQGV